MDKSIICEKVKKIVADEQELDPSEVTVNTKIVKMDLVLTSNG